MKQSSIIGCVAILIALHFSQSFADDQDFSPLFDGKSFAGWEGNLKVFRIEDGAIVAGSLKEKIPNNEFLCTEQQFGDFELRLKAKLVGEGKNAGIQFRSQRIPDHHEVKGYQCDIGEMRGRLIWGWIYDESRRKKFLAESDDKETKRAFKPNDWNELVIRCEGNRIQTWLNGYQTVDYTEKEKGIESKGIIGLQIHSGPPTEAWYKDIVIRDLTKKQ